MSNSLTIYTAKPKDYPGRRLTKKTIIVDLDSTLVYTFTQKPNGFNASKPEWFLDRVPEEDGTVTEYYVLIRPYAREFLERCREHYTIIFFTAAERDYADPIFDHLCPSVELSHRFFRDSCTVHNDIYFKDLRELRSIEFDEKKMFLFDDNAPENTIPRSNGMFCSQFSVECSLSENAIEELLTDNALESFAELFCSERFLNAEDIREPLQEYDRLLTANLTEPL